MNTTDHRDRKTIGLPLVCLQMAISAIAFMVVLGIVAVVMPLWQFAKRLTAYDRHHRTVQNNSVASVLVVERDRDKHTHEIRESREIKAYCRLLLRHLTEEVQNSFKEQHGRPPSRISELIQQLDQAPPQPHAYAVRWAGRRLR